MAICADRLCNAEQFTLKIGEKTYNWSNFLRTINDKIYNITESEDKQMGNRFVNPHETERILSGYLGTTTIKEKIIDEDVFVNKVLFYLWFDIFKNSHFVLVFVVGRFYVTLKLPIVRFHNLDCVHF